MIAEAAVVLRVVILENHHGLVGGHEPPRGGRKLAPGGPSGVELGDMLAPDPAELVAHAYEREFRDVVRAARAVARAEIIVRRQRIARPPDHLEAVVRNGAPLGGRLRYRDYANI